ncbi:protein kinase [Nonomuraea sp. NPDC050663]|uniref:protein kinase domain-containing protein n=1 Tax=Nonomuraea sp. NPDC050663 TaxID=3364370 RepID=UPI0037BC8973
MHTDRRGEDRMARGGSGEGMPPGVRPLTVGDPVIIGRYLLLGRLGVGGMGVVYLAEHPRGGLVALKTPHAVHLNDATLRARFAEEISSSRRIVPFCTAAVLEDGLDRNRPYLVTEYIRGPALNQVVSERGPLTPDLAYGVALGTAAALVAVHDAGLVHRDLKPANVLLSPRGPWVIDFGIARDLHGSGGESDPLTQAGQVMGSPGWVAPERLTGGPAVPASDVFSWGCLVAYAATGHHPFGSGEQETLIRRMLLEAPRLAGVPELLRPAVSAALAKAPQDRPSSAELLRALLAAGGVGDPWDLREAVARVLGEIWTAVPAVSVSQPPRREERQTGQTAPRRRRARQSAHLSHASFAALATVSIAALTVAAASGGVTGFGAVPAPETVPIIRPHGSAESTIRPIVAGTSQIATPSAPGSGEPTIIVTRTATVKPSSVVSSRSMPGFQDGTPRGDGRDDEPPPDGCLNPAGNRRGNSKRCPEPSSSISSIPQEGPGEESPTPTPSGSITTIPQEGPGEESPAPTTSTVPSATGS